MPDQREEESDQRPYPLVGNREERYERRRENQERCRGGKHFGAGMRTRLAAGYDAERPSHRVAGHDQDRQRPEDAALVQNLEVPALRVVGDVGYP
jgi:hypothetical protein